MIVILSISAKVTGILLSKWIRKIGFREYCHFHITARIGRGALSVV